MIRRHSRRSVLGASLGLGAGALLPLGSLARQGTPGTTGWSMTDGRGITVERDTVPANVIAQTISGASLWDFGVKVKGIFGDALREDGTPDPQTGDLNLDEVEVLGT